jgi:hypothetical protein
LVSVLNLFSRVEFLHRMLSEPLRNMVDIVQQHGSEEQFDAFGPGGPLCPRFPVEFVTFCRDAGWLGGCQQEKNGTYCSRMSSLELFALMLSHSEVKFYDDKQRSTGPIEDLESIDEEFPLEGYFVRHARPVRYRRSEGPHRLAMATEELFAWLRKQCASFGAQAGLLTLSKGKSSHACMFTVCDGNIVVCNHRHCFQDGRPIGKKKGGGYFASGKEFKFCNLLLLADGGERGEGSNQNTQPPQTRKRGSAAQKGPPKTPKNAKKQRTNDNNNSSRQRFQIYRRLL